MKVLAVSAAVMEPTSEVATQTKHIILNIMKVKNAQTCITQWVSDGRPEREKKLFTKSPTPLLP